MLASEFSNQNPNGPVKCIQTSTFTLVSDSSIPVGLEEMYEKLKKKCGDKVELWPVILEAWSTFVENQSLILREALSIEPEDIAKLVNKEAVSAYIGDTYPIDLRPSGRLERGAKLDICRNFSVGGKQLLSWENRVCSKEMWVQLRNIFDSIPPNTPVSIVDDVCFSARTLREVAALFERQGFTVSRFIVETLVGEGPKEVETRGVLQLLAPEGEDVFNYVDVVEMENFLPGIGGCWVDLPSGLPGLAPYVFPCASPVIRASIPENTAEDFSKKTIDNAISFYQTIRDYIGKSISVHECGVWFGEYVQEVFKYKRDERKESIDIIELLSEMKLRTSEMRAQVTDLETIQRISSELNLPYRLVFIDVNGTLISDGEEALSKSIEAQFKKLARLTQSYSFRIGLCSDSPLEGLRILAKKYGFDGPLIAENGSILSDANGNVLVVRNFEQREAVLMFIRDYFAAREILENPPILAAEFGGSPSDLGEGTFAFGSGRQESIAIFGERGSLFDLSEKLKEIFPDLRIDYDPKVGFGRAWIGISPQVQSGNPKGETLEILSKLGCDVWMIGNSESDLPLPGSKVKCGLVGNNTVPKEKIPEKALLTPLRHELGVYEILDRIIPEWICVM